MVDKGSKKIVYQSKFFHIAQVAVEHKGKAFTKDIIERRDVVFILPLTTTDEIYLVSQYRDAIQKISLEVVAGQMDEGEVPLESAKRELQEETGLTAQHWKQIATWHVSANMVGRVFVFVATDLTEGIAAQDEDEDITLVKLPVADALEKTLTGEIDISSNVAALHIFASLRKEGKI